MDRGSRPPDTRVDRFQLPRVDACDVASPQLFALLLNPVMPPYLAMRRTLRRVRRSMSPLTS